MVLQTIAAYVVIHFEGVKLTDGFRRQYGSMLYCARASQGTKR